MYEEPFKWAFAKMLLTISIRAHQTAHPDTSNHYSTIYNNQSLISAAIKSDLRPKDTEIPTLDRMPLQYEVFSTHRLHTVHSSPAI